ncbi:MULTISPECIES: hypothetical protein [Exiguobacterium]|uniref:hypothetical protein n=1 Tax=Exiguobacterium TaxID=33986 RepID=UPI000689269C|nr:MULTISPECIES: hypothetical protein [Exiguobacterium]HBQ77671.1 hypothetical protein [Exiguobacterium sp.]HCD60092.1 hypothetical protein [Exiguobacterium sp.]
MKKFRGKRRYFKNLELEFKSYSSPSYIDSDDWHVHPDFYGHGNTSLRLRKAHLRIALSALQDMRQKLEEKQIEHQIYMTIAREDASQDALHVHTQNPVGTPFPLEQIQSLSLSADVPEWITDLFSTHAYTIYQSQEEFTDFTEDEPITSTVTLFYIIPSP